MNKNLLRWLSGWLAVAALLLTVSCHKKPAPDEGTEPPTGESTPVSEGTSEEGDSGSKPVEDSGKKPDEDPDKKPDVPQIQYVESISTVEELLAFVKSVNEDWRTYEGRTVTLKADLDLTGVSWEPIGNQVLKTEDNTREKFKWNAFDQDWGESSRPIIPIAFSGTFDGQGHKITGLDGTLSRDLSGFFGLLIGATVKDLGIEGTLKVKDQGHYVGLMAGGAIRCRFENCYVKGTVEGVRESKIDVNNVGGFVGGVSADKEEDVTELVNCYAVVNMTKASQYTCGGMVGSVFGIKGNLTMTNCYADIRDITAYDGLDNGCYQGAGLLIGYVEKATLNNCFAVTSGTACKTLVAPPCAGGTGLDMKTSLIASAEAFRTAAALLGDAYKTPAEDGYPVLKWEAVESKENPPPASELVPKEEAEQTSPAQGA